MSQPNKFANRKAYLVSCTFSRQIRWMPKRIVRMSSASATWRSCRAWLFRNVRSNGNCLFDALLAVRCALRFLTTMTPLYLFILECLGTARILLLVHPFASNKTERLGQKMSQSDSLKTRRRGVVGSRRVTTQERLMKSHLCDDTAARNVPNRMQKPLTWLLLRFFVASITFRLRFSANFASESLLTIPPPS
jgi:hypothetical protein